jgi:hypothetical protein
VDRKIIKILAELEEALVKAGLSESDSSDLVDEIEDQIGEALGEGDEEETQENV